MRRAIFILMVICVVGSGCSTKSAYIETPGAEPVDSTAQFNTGNISDLSGFKFEPDDEDAFSLADTMKSSLQAALNKHLPQNTSKQYVIDINILEYAPGNAFIRWLAPGAGATTLNVEAKVNAEDGKTYATIPVSRAISAGGGFTIGAWKHVFDDVAEEIVSVITNRDKRKSIK